MFLTSPFLQLSSSLKPHPSPFLHGSSAAIPFLPKASPFSLSPAAPPPPPSLLSVKAMKKMQGRVVCATNDKTVAVEVVRLAPHPKYKRRIRKKKKYQAHDPLNQFKVGDFVELERSRPISKTKAFVAVPVTARNAPKPVDPVPADLLGLPLESQQQE
ncbi:30S ribosomal protein S17, chloroplastic [Cocos nucifera]|nr:30S ribosomal protein S17, chloroplastic [Cocos nucifera]